MIQRVQSIWLFLAALTLFLLLILPVVSTHTSTGDLSMLVGGLYQKINNVTQQLEAYTVLFAGTIFIGLICLANIFLFKNRSLQKRVILLITVLIIVLAAGIAAVAVKTPALMETPSVQAGACLPVLAIIFCALAFRGIRKDEQLIRSADRLR